MCIRDRSGSIITANLAAEYGREVLAFPGRVEDSLSQGTLGLIRNGATLVTNSSEVFEVLGFQNVGEVEPQRLAREVIEGLGARSKEILCFLQESGDKSFDEIQSLAEISSQELSLGLVELLRAKVICQLPGDIYRPLFPLVS